MFLFHLWFVCIYHNAHYTYWFNYSNRDIMMLL
nr:MAG TPA: hypothetical protein [Caudoviricetes sp.]